MILIYDLNLQGPLHLLSWCVNSKNAIPSTSREPIWVNIMHELRMQEFSDLLSQLIKLAPNILQLKFHIDFLLWLTFGLDEMSSNLVSRKTWKERDGSGHCFRRDNDGALIPWLAFRTDSLGRGLPPPLSERCWGAKPRMRSQANLLALFGNNETRDSRTQNRKQRHSRKAENRKGL